MVEPSLVDAAPASASVQHLPASVADEVSELLVRLRDLCATGIAVIEVMR